MYTLIKHVKNKLFVIYSDWIGAGGGIGRAICRLMAKEGAIIVATDININNVQSTVADLTGRTIFTLMILFTKHNFRRRTQKLSTRRL